MKAVIDTGLLKVGHQLACERRRPSHEKSGTRRVASEGTPTRRESTRTTHRRDRPHVSDWIFQLMSNSEATTSDEEAPSVQDQVVIDLVSESEESNDGSSSQTGHGHLLFSKMTRKRRAKTSSSTYRCHPMQL